jgi:hypothetical protein
VVRLEGAGPGQRELRARGGEERHLGRVGAPLPVEVDGEIAGIIGWVVAAAVLGLETPKRGPRLDQGPVHGKVLVAHQPQALRVCHYAAKNSRATSCSNSRARLRVKLLWSKLGSSRPISKNQRNSRF